MGSQCRGIIKETFLLVGFLVGIMELDDSLSEEVFFGTPKARELELRAQRDERRKTLIEIPEIVCARVERMLSKSEGASDFEFGEKVLNSKTEPPEDVFSPENASIRKKLVVK
jgi:hypothetical protein